MGQDFYIEDSFNTLDSEIYGINFFRSKSDPRKAELVTIWFEGKDITDTLTQETLDYAQEKADFYLSQ